MSGQLHFELDASMKLFTELTTLAASLVTVAICAAEGFAGRAATAAKASGTRARAPPWRARDLPGRGLSFIVIDFYQSTPGRAIARNG